MKPALLLSVAIVVAAMIVANSLAKVRSAILAAGVNSRAPYPPVLRVEPPPGGFRVTGDFQRSPEPRPANGNASSQYPYAQIANVRLVESRVTAAQLAAAPQTLLGRWRDENSFAEYRADGTCTWTLDSGEVRTCQWRIEADTIFETTADGKYQGQHRILELDDRHFVYQQFPSGSVWHAARASAAAAEVAH